MPGTTRAFSLSRPLSARFSLFLTSSAAVCHSSQDSPLQYSLHTTPLQYSSEIPRNPSNTLIHTNRGHSTTTNTGTGKRGETAKVGKRTMTGDKFEQTYETTIPTTFTMRVALPMVLATCSTRSRTVRLIPCCCSCVTCKG